MRPSKHYASNIIWEDKAGTRYTIAYNDKTKCYHMYRLQPNNEIIANSGCTFTRWINELKPVGMLI